MAQDYQPLKKTPKGRPPLAEAAELEDFGSNAERLATLGLDATAELPAEKAPAPLDRQAVSRGLGSGSRGDDVKVLQAFLGFEGEAVDGQYGKYTAGKVREWQTRNGLVANGAVDTRTLAAMRGDPWMYGYSMGHDPGKFVPKYPMTAYHESGVYRTAADPYAVGAISRPGKKDDVGGKTYGAYQFESYHYPDGTKDEKAAPGSTLQRFVDWKDNPYGKRLKEVIEQKGIASADFDKLWGELAGKENKSFGEAQQQFLELDVAERVKALMDTAGASQTARQDSRLVDLMMGTVNQYGGLADDHVRAAATAGQKAGRPLTAEEIALAIQDSKLAAVGTNFKSSPNAQAGVKARIADERAVFAPRKK